MFKKIDRYSKKAQAQNSFDTDWKLVLEKRELHEARLDLDHHLEFELLQIGEQ